MRKKLVDLQEFLLHISVFAPLKAGVLISRQLGLPYEPARPGGLMYELLPTI